MAGHDTQPVLIAGGGIGGLAVALGLARKGIRSVLLEKASALGEIGAGIQLGPNAFHAFDYLGVGEAELVKRPLPFATRLYQAGILQQAEVHRDARLSNAGDFLQFVHRQFVLFQQRDDAQPRRV